MVPQLGGLSSGVGVLAGAPGHGLTLTVAGLVPLRASCGPRASATPASRMHWPYLQHVWPQCEWCACGRFVRPRPEVCSREGRMVLLRARTQQHPADCAPEIMHVMWLGGMGQYAGNRASCGKWQHQLRALLP